MAHHIFFEGVNFGMSVAEFPDDFSSVEIIPFSHEIASTIFIEGAVSIRKSGETYIVEKSGKKIDI